MENADSVFMTPWVLASRRRSWSFKKKKKKLPITWWSLVLLLGQASVDFSHGSGPLGQTAAAIRPVTPFR